MSRHDTMGARLRTAGLVLAAMGISITTSVYLARAAPGQATAPTLAFAGVLRGVASNQMLTFHFRKGGQEVCKATIDSGPIDPTTGSFRVLIPIGSCPPDLFDGSDVTYDIDVGAVPGVATDAPVSAVPYAKYADQAGYPDCPVGYDNAKDPNFVVCKKGNDEVVKVGNGASAFWIDRYEASVWKDPAGTTGAALNKSYGENGDDYPGTFPKNGQVTQRANLLYAVSRKGVYPSAYLTWFQANLACLAGGKRLPTGPEWLLAATGTQDPTLPSAGDQGTCLTQASQIRMTGADKVTVNCASVWGAEDMIGNVWEWTAEWDTGVGDATPAFMPWPDPQLYGDDRTWNIQSHASTGDDDDAGVNQGAPSTAIRGGSGFSGTPAGVFAISVYNAPSRSSHNTGFRCLLPR